MSNLNERVQRLREFRTERDRVLQQVEWDESKLWVKEAMEALTEARIQQERANLSAQIAREILRSEMDEEAAQSLEELKDHLDPNSSSQDG
jgi:hypothetical protein